MDFYVFAGIGLFGFFFTLISFVLGEVGHLGDGAHFDMGHDGELSAEHEVAGGHEHDGSGAETGEGPGPLSARVISIFLTTFGTVAAAARYSGLSSLTSVTLGLASGYVLGWSMWRIMRFLWAQGGSSELHTRDLVGCVAEVTVAIPAEGIGQVCCVIEDKCTYPVARAATGSEIPLGATVRISQVTAEGVLVTPAPMDNRSAPGAVKSL